MVKNGQKFVIFSTKWGFFCLVGTNKAVVGSYLPAVNRGRLFRRVLRDWPEAEFDENFKQGLQERVRRYFEGARVEFIGEKVSFDKSGGFAADILAASRGIGFGQRISYGQLAKRAGYPKAARAVGRVLASNKLPLIIPCHRVIRGDGRLGGFSAAGGMELKAKLLEHEKNLKVKR